MPVFRLKKIVLVSRFLCRNGVRLAVLGLDWPASRSAAASTGLARGREETSVGLSPRGGRPDPPVLSSESHRRFDEAQVLLSLSLSLPLPTSFVGGFLPAALARQV